MFCEVTTSLGRWFHTDIPNPNPIGSQTTVSFGWLHMYSDNIGAELSLGIPPKLTLDLKRANGTTEQGAATVKSLTPAAIAKYFFNTPQDKIRPYLGLGVSYVTLSYVMSSLLVKCGAFFNFHHPLKSKNFICHLISIRHGSLLVV